MFVLFLISGLGAWPRAVAALCPSILVASSDEKSALMTQLAKDYSAVHGNSWSGCGPVVTVEDVASGDAEHRLEKGWLGAGRPDVWTPAAKTWVLLLQNRRPDMLANDPPSIATSPLVVAMPQAMAHALGWPKNKLSWKDLFLLAADPRGWGRFGHADWGPFRLGKTDPRVSTSGINSWIAEYFAATGKSSDLTDPDLKASATTEFVNGVERSVSHYAPTVGSFLNHLATANSLTYISALAVEEQELFNYNLGGYGPPNPKVAPSSALEAIYPAEGTLVADHPYVILRGPWVTAAKQSIANDFLAWLQSSSQQRRFSEIGLRNYNMEASGPLLSASGIEPVVPTPPLHLPSADVVRGILTSWDTVRKPARIVMMLDLADASERRAVRASLAELSDRDQLAVLGLAQAQGSQDMTPQSLQGGGRMRAQDAIDLVPINVRAGPLYEAVKNAYQFLSLHFDPEFINAVVVIASHPDAVPGPTALATLETEIGAQAALTPVRIYTVALPGSDGQGLLGIETASGGVSISSTTDPAAAIRTCLGNF